MIFIRGLLAIIFEAWRFYIRHSKKKHGYLHRNIIHVLFLYLLMIARPTFVLYYDAYFHLYDFNVLSSIAQVFLGNQIVNLHVV